MLIPKKRKEKKREESEASHIKCFGYLYPRLRRLSKNLAPKYPANHHAKNKTNRSEKNCH